MFLIALECAVVAYVYVTILTKPGHILHKWALLLEKELIEETFIPYYKRKEHWLYKPLIGCELCCAGQLSLWSCILNDHFNPVFVTITICMAILFTKIISLVINRLNEQNN